MSHSSDTSLIIKAANFAAFKHRNQRRKDADASPYINHPLALANVLSNEAGIADHVVICAALLHDTGGLPFWRERPVVVFSPPQPGALVSLTYILIDFENVQPTSAEMSLIRGSDYRVRLFHGPHQNKFDAAMVKGAAAPCRVISNIAAI